MSIDFAALKAEFPKEAIHWRAQSLTKDGSKAMALAYLDARAVMDRLDAVCGPERWQDSYMETTQGRLICTLSIQIGGEWVSKSDGAGETDIEGEKGAISGALKRAAVKWGIGRYLYDVPTPWVPCETYTDRNGKPKWKGWKADPWAFVTGAAPRKDDAARKVFRQLVNEIRKMVSIEQLDSLVSYDDFQAATKGLPADWQEELRKEYKAAKDALTAASESTLMAGE